MGIKVISSTGSFDCTGLSERSPTRSSSSFCQPGILRPFALISIGASALPQALLSEGHFFFVISNDVSSFSLSSTRP
jgi:hypothetical protein